MSDNKKTTIAQTTSFLAEKQDREDDSAAKLVGPRLVNELVRLFKNSDIFGVEHQQLREMATETTSWLGECFQTYKEEEFSLQMTSQNIFFNGQLLKFEENQYARSVILRAIFLTFSINQLTFERGIGPGELIAMLKAVKEVREGKSGGLEGFSQPHLKLTAVGHRDLEDLAEADERRVVIELYAGLIIKCAVYFHQLQRTSSASARHIKRLVQKIADKFEEHRNVFIGLINLKLIIGQDFVHAVNTALYAMFIAHEVELDRLDLVRVAMTAITQDIHRLRREFDEDEDIELGKPSHFRTNMNSVMMLSEMGSSDLLSALRLVTSYERGFPYNKPLPDAWYREEMRPHLLSRIVELARHYDLLTQGMDGQRPLKSDLALQAISDQMGRHYDPKLTKLFINLVGVYPVGEIVRLSTSERAIVIQSPTVAESTSNKSVAHRPVVRLLDGSERIVDLSAQANHSIRIVEILDRDAVEEQPGAFFFF